MRTLTTELFDISILVYEVWNVIHQDMHVRSNLDKLTFSTKLIIFIEFKLVLHAYIVHTYA